MTISGCKACPQAEWEETQEETYLHGQLAAAAAAGPCTSTALSISTPVGMWWVHVVQWAALITAVLNSSHVCAKKKAVHNRDNRNPDSEATFKFSWLCIRIQGPSSHCLSFRFSCWDKIPWLKTTFPMGLIRFTIPGYSPPTQGSPSSRSWELVTLCPLGNRERRINSAGSFLFVQSMAQTRKPHPPHAGWVSPPQHK